MFSKIFTSILFNEDWVGKLDFHGWQKSKSTFARIILLQFFRFQDLIWLIANSIGIDLGVTNDWRFNHCRLKELYESISMPSTVFTLWYSNHTFIFFYFLLHISFSLFIVLDFIISSSFHLLLSSACRIHWYNCSQVREQQLLSQKPIKPLKFIKPTLNFVKISI